MASTETPNVLICARCRKTIADGQRVEHRGATYCADCVGQSLDTALNQQRSRHSVALAVLLSIIPGLGQMYNRQLKKGALVLGAYLLIPIGLGTAPNTTSNLIPVLLIPLYFWNLFDAYWVAKRINRSDEAEEELPPEEDDLLSAIEEKWEGSSMLGFGILLIALGVIFLLNNFGIDLLSSDRLWPAVFLVLGLWLLFSFAMSRRAAATALAPVEEAKDVEGA